MLELVALGVVHRHHPHAARALGAGRLLLAQPGVGDRGDRARELARRRLRRAAHVGRRQLGEARQVAQPLDDLGRGREQQLPPQPEPLDQPVHVEIRPRGVQRARGGPVELQEDHDPLARLGRDLRRLERGGQRRDHVELAPPRDLGHAREVDRPQLDRRPRQRAHDGARVARVHEQPQPGQQVAHLGALEERRGAATGSTAPRAPRTRPRPPGPRRAPSARARRRPPARRPARDQPLDVGRHRLRLRALGRAAPERDLAVGGVVGRRRAASRSGPRSAPRPPRGRDHAPRGAQRHVEPHDRRLRPLGAEVADVLGRRAAEAVDRLVVVGERADPAVLGDQQPQQQALGEARVLQLVDEHVPVARREPRAHVRLLAQQPERLQHEVADVERARLGQQPVVGGEQRRELALARARRVVGQPRRPRRVVGGRDELVLERVDPPHDRAERRGRVAAQVVVAQRQVSMRSSSIASRSAAVTGVANGSMPASSASSRSSRAHRPPNVVDRQLLVGHRRAASSIRSRSASASSVSASSDVSGGRRRAASHAKRSTSAVVLPVPAAAEHEQRPPAVLDGLALGGGQHGGGTAVG